MIEINEVLSDASSFGLIGLEDRSRGEAINDGSEFPSEVVRVLHGNIHALSCNGERWQSA